MVREAHTKTEPPCSWGKAKETWKKPSSVHGKNHPILVKARDVAEALSVSPRQICYWAQEGRIPCHKLGTRCVRFCLPDVLAALGVQAEGGSK